MDLGLKGGLIVHPIRLPASWNAPSRSRNSYDHVFRLTAQGTASLFPLRFVPKSSALVKKQSLNEELPLPFFALLTKGAAVVVGGLLTGSVQAIINLYGPLW